MRTVLAACALLALGACASSSPGGAPSASAFDPAYADGASREFTVVRDSILYAAPRADAPELGRIRKGETLTAGYSRVSAAWMRVDLENGEHAFVFGTPLYPTN